MSAEGAAYERFTGALSAAGKSGKGGDWQCPAHADNKPSLHVANRDQGDGGIVVKCHAGCDRKDVVEALGLKMADLYDAPPLKLVNGGNIAYEYTAENGNPLMRVVRKTPKGFWLQHPDPTDPTGWTKGADGVRRVLFHLPALIAGIEAGRDVFLVEGEKDVLSLEAKGEIATCNAGGVEGWKPEFSEVFTGASVFIIADKDASGRKYTRERAQELGGIAESVTVLEAAAGKDATDHFMAGKTVDEFTIITTNIPGNDLLVPWNDYLDGAEPIPEAVAIGSVEQADLRASLPLDVLTIKELAELPPPTWLIEGVLPNAAIALLWGKPGTKKSFVALDIALSVSSGAWWQNRKTEKGSVLYIAAEGATGLNQRREAWAEDRNVRNLDNIVFRKSRVNLLDKEDVDKLQQTNRLLATKLVIIDTLNRSMPGGDENSSTTMSTAIDVADVMRQETGATVLLIHHSTKDGDNERGHSALSGGIDTSIKVTSDNALVKLHCSKQKDAAEFDSIAFHVKPVLNSIVLDSKWSDSGEADEHTASETRMLTDLWKFCHPQPLNTSAFMKAANWPESSFHETKNRLLQKGLLINDGTKARPLWAPVGELVS